MKKPKYKPTTTFREDTNPDHAARIVAMSAFLYYSCASPVLSDGDYEQYARYVSDHWDELEAFRKYQLGDAKSIRTSGHRILVTTLCHDGAISWHRAVFNKDPIIIPPLNWFFNEEHQQRFAKITG